MRICEHLESILTNELNNGNSIKDINENAWSNALLVINLSNKIDKGLADQEALKQSSIQYFEISDNHYELQYGYYCKTCKHAITSPK